MDTKKDPKGKGRRSPNEKERQERLERRLEAEDALKACREGAKQKAKAARAAEWRTAYLACKRSIAESNKERKAKATTAATSSSQPAPATSSRQDEPQPKFNKASTPLRRSPRMVEYNTDEQASKFAEWCANLPAGLPEMYKFQQACIKKQVWREENPEESSDDEVLTSQENQESSDDNGHEADDEDT